LAIASEVAAEVRKIQPNRIIVRVFADILRFIMLLASLISCCWELK
jgi:hypothetical protein